MNNLRLWMSAKGLVVGALLLLGFSVAAGDDDCTDKNPSKLPKEYGTCIYTCACVASYI